MKNIVYLVDLADMCPTMHKSLELERDIEKDIDTYDEHGHRFP